MINLPNSGFRSYKLEIAPYASFAAVFIFSEKTIKTRKLTGNPVLPDFCCLCVLIMKHTLRQMITMMQISTNTITLAEITKNEMNVKSILFKCYNV